MNYHLKRYERIVQHYVNYPPGDSFCERHHIKPLCMGGEDNRENIVVVPARAHIICHYLLHKAYPQNVELAHAFAMMCVNNKHQNRVFSSRLYEAAKIARSRALKGKPRPEWVKEKLRKPKSDTSKYFGNTNARGNFGKKRGPMSSTHKENVRIALQSHYESRKRKTAEKIARLREKFANSKMTRKQFAICHGLSITTVKRYLHGL